MPWYVQILINLAIKYGPIWLLKVFPSLPVWVRDIINDLINELPNIPKPERKAARKRASEKCIAGVVCPPDLK